MGSRILRVVSVLAGIALVGAILGDIDLAEVWRHASRIGWGLMVVVGLYFMGFVIDSLTWQMTIASVPLDARWLYRTWKVRMVGEVLNSVIPAGGMGGEPLKAVLLNRHYGVGYREGTASLILAKTINMVALVAFLGLGFGLILGSPTLAAAYKLPAGVGLAAFALGTFLLFAVQRFRIASHGAAWLGRFALTRRIAGVLHHIRDMDDRLVRFYAVHHGRFAAAVALAFVNWLVGVAEVYATTAFLDRPISLGDSWIVEATAQLVRAGTFFIPASLGAQEGAFLLSFAALTGSAELGIAVALIRRFRELLWILWGVALGSLFTLRPAAVAAAPRDRDDAAG